MIPKSKIFTTSSGGPSGMKRNSSQIKTIQAATKIGYNVTEPNQSQTVTVNIGKDIQELEKYPEIAEEPITVPEKNDSTMDLTRRYNEIITCKDKYIHALHIMLNIVRNNPLIIKHFGIANSDNLNNLVRLLTNADEVEITLNYDVDFGCCGDCRVASVDKKYVGNIMIDIFLNNHFQKQ